MITNKRHKVAARIVNKSDYHTCLNFYRIISTGCLLSISTIKFYLQTNFL